MSRRDETVESLIERFRLIPHPEGGWYRQTYVSGISSSFGLSRRGSRPLATSIYFLLTRGHFSAFHRLQSDEMWYHHSGDALRIEIIHRGGRYESALIGPADRGFEPQFCVPADCWFASRIDNGGHWGLVGCSVFPGFDFRDFELADYDELSAEYPEHRGLIRALTR